MSNVKSVYNFVPAPNESEVFKPDWADMVSHDIPFEDGESGEIELKITAKSPIFIRNGHSKKDAELFEKQRDGNLQNPTDKENEAIERYLSFSNVTRNGKKEYFIPGSSLKGMFRNVLEIMSKSRMKQIADDRYSFRDLKRDSIYMKSYNANEVSCGWLKEDYEGRWIVEDMGEPALIHHKEVDKILGTKFRKDFLEKQPKGKTAKFKYDNIKDKNKLVDSFETLKNNNKLIAKQSADGNNGIIVLTGQSGPRKEKGKFPSGKVHEFVFFSKTNSKEIIITERQKKDFKFIYLDHDKQNISKDWEYWKIKLEKGNKVPVFFNKSGGAIKHFGLAFMYKLPFDQSIHETLPYRNYSKNKKDLSELIFGSIDKNETSLKGRVYISHAFSHIAEEDYEKSEILASPKASYYPFYLKQENNINYYKTYMDNDAVLRGYKRYPIQGNIRTGYYDENQINNKKVFSIFKPLKEDALFTGKIRFHNLRKFEIGALISAITFHGNENNLYHSLGGAKPYGYGQVSVNIKGKPKYLKHDLNDYYIAFEKIMGGNKWLESNQITELFSMAGFSDESLKYPEAPKTFVDYKADNEDGKEALHNYTEIIKPKKVKPKSFIAEKELIENPIDFNTKSLKELKKQIKDMGLKEIPNNRIQAFNIALTKIFNNHRESRRKLSNKEFDSQYDWNTTISDWIGRDNAINLYRKLTGKNDV